MADIERRVCLQQHYIGPLSDVDRTFRRFTAEKACGIDRRGLKTLKGCESRLCQPFKLIMQAKTWNQPITPGEERLP